MNPQSLFSDLVSAFQFQSECLAACRIDLADFPSIVGQAREFYLQCLGSKKTKHRPVSIVRHADEYASFLCFLAREAYRHRELELAEVAYLVNRRLHSFDCFYTRDIPDFFHLEHPVGSVLGPAVFSNYLVVYQSVTVGGDISESYPAIGESVALFSKCSVIGRSVIGSNCAIGSHVQLYSESVPTNTAVKYVAVGDRGSRSFRLQNVVLKRSVRDMFFLPT